MIVLGITETHCATAAVLRDLGIAATEVDLVALAGRNAYPREWMNRVLHDTEYAREYYGVRLDRPSAGLSRRARKLGARLGLGGGASGKTVITDAERIGLVTRHVGVASARIVAFDHHACHAASAYFGAPFQGRDAVVLTNDNSGDGLCATAHARAAPRSGAWRPRRVRRARSARSTRSRPCSSE